MSEYETIRKALELGHMLVGLNSRPVFEAGKAALATIEARAREPVAWRLMLSGEAFSYRESIPDLSKLPKWRESGIDWQPLYAAPPAPVAEIRDVEVTDEMCGRVCDAWYAGRGNRNRTAATSGREMIAAVRSELGPALGLVEIREPSDGECREIADSFLESVAIARRGVRTGRAMFNAVKKWQEGLK